MIRRPSWLRLLPRSPFVSLVSDNTLRCKRIRLASTAASFDSITDGAAYSAKHTRSKGEVIPETAAARAPGLQTLAARLKLEDVPYSTLARTLITESSSLSYTNNSGLAKFGKTLLDFYVYEHFIVKHPRLPSRVLRHVVDKYTATVPLAEVGALWGVEQDTRTKFARYLANLQDEKVLGRLSYTDATQNVEDGVTKLIPGITMDYRTAAATFVRALVAAVYAHRGLDGVREFVFAHIIKPRKVAVEKLMAFSQPSRELAVLCEREGLTAPMARLIVESGRYSATPVFVVGVFSGDNKLGEGQGASIKEARTRACVNALQGWYLYSPVENFGYVDSGEIVI